MKCPNINDSSWITLKTKALSCEWSDCDASNACLYSFHRNTTQKLTEVLSEMFCSGDVQESGLSCEILSMDWRSWETRWRVSASPISWLETERQVSRLRMTFLSSENSHKMTMAVRISVRPQICQQPVGGSCVLYVMDMWWRHHLRVSQVTLQTCGQMLTEGSSGRGLPSYSGAQKPL